MQSTAKPDLQGIEGDTTGRRARRKLETRARIEEAAYGLFQRNGVDGTSIEMVCNHADVARRTFYSYYANKQELLAQMGVRRLYDQAEPMMASLMARFDTTAERIGGMIDYVEENFSHFNDVDRQIILLAPTMLTPGTEMHEAIENSGMGSFIRLIEAGREKGEVGPGISSEMIATTIMGTLNLLTTQWAAHPDFPIIERLEEARKLFAALLAAGNRDN